MAAKTTGVRFRFGNFELQPGERRLLSSGVPIDVRPRAFDVLVLLVERGGSLVTKDEMLAHAWPGVVVEENAVQVQVSALRKLLGADAIATVSRQGYRLGLDVVRTTVDSPAVAQAVPHNLPHALTRFIGREREVEEVRALLGGARLLCLTGAGGCGKTRLALRVAQELHGAYPDGVWLVELAPLADPGLVPNAMAAALGVKEHPGKSMAESLTDELASRRLLVILDNAEHLLDAVAGLGERVVRRCGEVTLLTTSRERLSIEGEVVYRVPPLTTPHPQHDRTPQRLADFESAQLFIDRVRLQRPQFTITPEDAVAVASICHRLDGLPLAIELAAARMRSMTVMELDRGLDQRFELLIGGSRTAMHRQRTLRAVVDWSYDLLDDAERALLRRLSVFAGGWTLEAAEQVCFSDAADAARAFELLTSLHDKSLLSTHEEHATTRFHMLETVREYAREQLTKDPEAASWQRRHFDYFLALAETTAPKLMVANPREVDTLDAEHDNLRHAFDWCSGPAGDSAKSIRFCAALDNFWLRRGYWDEGLASLMRALTSPSGSEDRSARAGALQAAGMFTRLRGDHDAARSLYLQSLSISRALGDLKAVSSTLLGMGLLDRDQGRIDSARELAEEALAIARQLGDTRLISRALNSLGNLASGVEDYVAARRFHEESLSIRRATNDRGGVAVALHNLALIDGYEGDLEKARARCEESVAIHRASGEPHAIATTLGQLGGIVFKQGEQALGEAMLKESLRVLSRLGDRFGVINALDTLAAIVSPVSADTAARIWGAAERLREKNGIPRRATDHAYLASLAAKTRAARGDDLAFDRAWQEGRAMELEQAVEYALGAEPGFDNRKRSGNPKDS